MEQEGIGCGGNQQQLGGMPVPGSKKFEDLPAEILDVIFSYLDGGTVMEIRSLSKKCKSLVDETLWGKKGQQYWLERCLRIEPPPSLFLKALASFQAIVGEAPTEIDELSTELQQRHFSNKLRETFVNFSQFRRACLKRVVVKRLEHVENFIREDLASGSSTRKATSKRAQSVESTNGSALFSLRWPSKRGADQAHLYVFENMKTCRRGLEVVDGKEKERVRSVQTITLPLEISSEEFTDDGFIKIPIICIIATDHHIVLAPLYRGSLTRIPLLLSTPGYLDPPCLPTEKRFAIWGDLIGVWLDPGTIHIHKMEMDRKSGDVSVKVIKASGPGFLSELWKFWISASVFPNYLPVLWNDFRNPFKKDPEPGFPVFSLISPVHPNFMVTYEDPPVKTFMPRLNKDTDFSEEQTLQMMHGSTFSHRKSDQQNLIVFFNHTWMGILFRFNIWIFQELRESLLAKDEILLDLEFESEMLLMLGTDQHIIMTFFRIVPPSEESVDGGRTMFWIRGRIQFEVIRKIRLDSFVGDPNLRMLHCHFDMDLGRPYIFMSFDLPKEKRTTTSLQLIKLEFGSDEEDMGEEMKCVEDGSQDKGNDPKGQGHP